jgi:hypothetical protein
VFASRSSRVLAPSTMRSPDYISLSSKKHLQCGRISGVVRVPKKLSGSKLSPASHSTTALNTSPLFPLRRCTRTSEAEIRPKVPFLLVLLPVSLAVVDAVRGRMANGFQDVESADARRARKYVRDSDRALCHAASSLTDISKRYNKERTTHLTPSFKFSEVISCSTQRRQTSSLTICQASSK